MKNSQEICHRVSLLHQPFVRAHVALTWFPASSFSTSSKHMHDCVTKHTNHTARDRRNRTDWFMFKERWPIRCSPDEMQFGRPNESLSLSPWNASFQTHRKRPSSYGTALPASTRSKKKKKKETSNHGATYEKPRKKMEKYTSIAGHVFKSARFRESCRFWWSIVHKNIHSFSYLRQLHRLYPLTSQNLYTTSCQLISSKK